MYFLERIKNDKFSLSKSNNRINLVDINLSQYNKAVF